MHAEHWLILTDYASKYRIGVSTLRRRIKQGGIKYRMDAGKYYIYDAPPKMAENAATSVDNLRFPGIQTYTVDQASLPISEGLNSEPHLSPLQSELENAESKNAAANSNGTTTSDSMSDNAKLDDPKRVDHPTLDSESNHSKSGQQKPSSSRFDPPKFDEPTRDASNPEGSKSEVSALEEPKLGTAKYDENDDTETKMSKFFGNLAISFPDSETQGASYEANQTPQSDIGFAPELVSRASVTEEAEEPMITTATRLLGELKRAYMNILQEKEEQLIHLKEEVSDLKTLVRVLEEDNSRMRRLLAQPTYLANDGTY